MYSESSLNALINAENLVLIWMHPSLKKNYWCLSDRASTSESIPNHLLHHHFFNYHYCLDLPFIRTPFDSTPSVGPHHINLLRSPPFSLSTSYLTVKTPVKHRIRTTAHHPWCKSIPSQRGRSLCPSRACRVGCYDEGLSRQWTGTM